MARVGAEWTSAQLALQVTAGNYDTERLIEVLAPWRSSWKGEKATLPCGPGQAAVVAVVERLPTYTPELNPAKGLWSSPKAVELANLTTPTLGEVIDQATGASTGSRRTPHPAYSLLRRPGLSVS